MIDCCILVYEDFKLISSVVRYTRWQSDNSTLLAPFFRCTIDAAFKEHLPTSFPFPKNPIVLLSISHNFNNDFDQQMRQIPWKCSSYDYVAVVLCIYYIFAFVLAYAMMFFFSK